MTLPPSPDSDYGCSGRVPRGHGRSVRHRAGSACAARKRRAEPLSRAVRPDVRERSLWRGQAARRRLRTAADVRTPVMQERDVDEEQRGLTGIGAGEHESICPGRDDELGKRDLLSRYPHRLTLSRERLAKLVADALPARAARGQVRHAQEHRRGASLVGCPDPFLRIEVVGRGRARHEERTGKSKQQSAHRSQGTGPTVRTRGSDAASARPRRSRRPCARRSRRPGRGRSVRPRSTAPAGGRSTGR